MQTTRHYLTLLLMLCCVSAQPQGREKYEYMRNLPVYADSLIADGLYHLGFIYMDRLSDLPRSFSLRK